MSRYTEAELVASVCQDSFYTFVQEFWSTIIPEDPVWNWHVKYLCDELQTMAEVVFRSHPREHDLVINIPPGTTKSTICSVMFPAWLWTRMPHAKFIGASYTQHLAEDLAMKCRDVVLSDKYRGCFPRIRLREDQNTKKYFRNTAGGYRYAVGVDGSVTGMHAHFIVVDDPLDPGEAASPLDLASANRWIKETLPTRKIDKRVTPTVLVMQRLHQDDPTALFLSRKRVRHIKLPAEAVDGVFPPELERNYRKGLLDPVRLSKQVLKDAEDDLGQYGFCTPGFTPILMENWKEKKIEDVQVGDIVMGYDSQIGKRRARTKIVRSEVLAKYEKEDEVVKVIMESGREVLCTADHRWWNRGTKTGKWKTSIYLPARVGMPLFSVYDPFDSPTSVEQRDWDWLGGFLDGEAGLRHGQIYAYQSHTVNPQVCRKLEKVLDRLKLSYTKVERDEVDERRPGAKPSSCYYIRGGRSMKMRMVNSLRMAKRRMIIDGIWKCPGKVAEKADKVVRIESVGKMKVYGMTTTTGNYVAWGYASENCSQFRQTPVPPGGGMFKVGRIKILERKDVPTRFEKVVRFWDKAGTMGGGDFTAGVKMGKTSDGRFVVLDVKRGQLDSWLREKLIKDTAYEDGYACRVGLEQSGGEGGKESAEATVANLAGFRVKVLKHGKSTGDKVARAGPFSSQVNGGNVYLVEGEWNHGYLEELKYFPFGKYDDQVDGSSGGFNSLWRKKNRVGGLRRAV